MRRHLLQSRTAGLLGLCLAVWGWAAVSLSAGQNQALDIASDATFPPFHYVKEGSAPTGFDIELARLAAERAGFQPVVMVRP